MPTCFVTGGSGFVGRSLIQLLRQENYTIYALARSERSANIIRQMGGIPVLGDLSDLAALQSGMQGCDMVFHLAASVNFWADARSLWLEHVTGTDLVIEAAKAANVRRLVYLGAASVIMTGKPIVNADETAVSQHLVDGYSQTKLAAEERVLDANSPMLVTVSVRPPLIWGRGDTSALPQIVEAAQKGQLMFIDGGKHEFVTAHVQNVCHALLTVAKADQRVGGEFFFVTDGKPLIFKTFIKNMLATQGVHVPDRSVSLGIARTMAQVLAGIWRTFRLQGQPPLYPGLVNTLGLPFTVSDAKLRRMTNFRPVITIEQGLREMAPPETSITESTTNN